MNFQRRLLSQNFFRDPKLVAHLVSRASFRPSDLILDIGAGTGIITGELAKTGARIIAVEIDTNLARRLQNALKNSPNVRIYQGDIRQFSLPNEPYKVFANLPFHLTADIIYKLLYYSSPPDIAYLVVQKEAAEKFAGVPKETQFSILAKPWFEFEVIWKFRTSDFYPSPKVETVLLKIAKKRAPLVPANQEILYKGFIKFAFNTWKKDLKNGLKNIFTYKQWRRLATNSRFKFHASPTDLTFSQWMDVFNCLVARVDKSKYERIKP